MTLKGMKKSLRNIIAVLISVILIGGITGVVYSVGKSSIKVSYNQSEVFDTWDTGKNPVFDKDWFVGNGNIELELDLSDYYNDLRNNQQSNIESNNDFNEEIVEGREKVYTEVPFTLEAYINDYSESNKINEVNIQITEVKNIDDEFYGKYKAEITMPQVEDCNIKFKISIIEGNQWGIPVIEPKTFEIKKDTIAPIVNISGVNNNEQYNKKTAIITVDELNIETTQLIVETHKLNDSEIITSKYENEDKLDINFYEENDYKLVAYAIDKSGNTSEKVEVSFSINSGAPKVTINEEEVADIYNTKTLKLSIYDKNKINFEDSIYQIIRENTVVETGKFEEENKKTGVKTIQLDEDGVYDIVINAKDSLGTPANIERKIKVDTSNPLITITQVSKEYLTKEDNREITISIEDNDILNANNIINVTKNGQPYRENLWNLNIEGEKGILSYNFDEEGEYHITVSSTDSAGNSGVTQEISFKVDLYAPTILIENNGKDLEDNTFLNEYADKNVSITIEDTFLIKPQVTVTKDGEPYQIKTIFESPTKMSLINNFTEDGEYIIVVNAEDKAGQPSNKTIKFTVDNIKPEIIISEEVDKVITAIVEGKNYNRDLNLLIETRDVNQDENTIEIIEKKFNELNKEFRLANFGDKIEVDGLEVVTLKDTLNDEKFKSSNEQESKIGSNGKYTLRVKSVDKAGNESKKTITFTIDKIAPEITIGKVEEFNQNGPMVNVTVREENADNEEEIDNEACQVIVSYTKVAQGEHEDINEPGTRLEEFKVIGTTTTKDYLGNNFELNGKYTVKVTATDAAGNVAEPKEVTFTKDSTKPTIEFSGLEVGTEYDDKHYNEDVTLNIKTTDFNQDINKIIIKGTFEGESIFENGQLELTDFKGTGNERTLEYTFDEEANYEVEIISTDKAGNTETTNKGTEEVANNIKFSVDKTAPVINILEFDKLNKEFNQSGEKVTVKVIEENFNTNDVKVSYTKQTPMGEGYNDAETINLDFKADKKEFIKEFSDENFKDDAIYVVTVTATDKAGNIAETKTVEFTTDTVPPEISIFYEENNKYEKKDDEQLSAQGVHEYQSKRVKVESYDVNQNINTVTITRDGETYEVDGFTTEGRTRTFEHNFTQEGDYVVTVVSSDLSARTSSKTFKFTIDTTSPVITIDDYNELIKNPFNNPGKNIKVNVKEHNFTYNTVEILLIKELEDTTVIEEVLEFPNIPNINDVTSHIYEKFVDDAKYTMKISAKDLAGNVATKEHLELTVTTDTTKPVAIINGIDEGEHYNTDKTVSVSIVDVNHDINRVTITKDGVAYFTSEDFNISGSTNVKTATLSRVISEEGEYEIIVYSRDKAGNELETPVTKKFTIDKTAPVITPVFKGENRVIKPGEYINKIFTPEFKLDKAEDKFDFITLNEGQDVTGAVPMSSTEMVYHYTGQASDKAGNTTPLDITFTVDVTNPEVKVTGIIDGYFSKDMKPEYEITDTNLDNENTIVTLNDKVFESGTKIKDQDYYNLKLLGTDLASNTTARNIVFTIDKDKPVIKFLEEMSGKYFTEDFIPNFVIEDLTDYTIIAMTLDGVDYEIGDPITEEGKHVLYIEVKDKAENVESISVEFILDKTPPKFIVNGIKDKGIYVEPVTAEITLENPLDKITGITVNGELAQGDVKEENGQQVVKLNFTDINDYEVVLKAVDEAGNETEEVINFKIAKKNIFTTTYANKALFYPLVIALAIIAVIVVIIVVRKNKKEETQEEGSEE